MLQGALERIGRPLMSMFAASGSDMEPDPEELQGTAAADDGSKAHLYRLFIAWVPKLFTEQDLRPLFDQCGDVKDIIILKDKVSGRSRGCAFVSYATVEEAEKAISMLDRGIHLPGALQPMEVRFARSHQYIQAGAGPDNNRQLFFARVPVLTTDADLRALFGQFGEVEDVDLFRERRTHLSKGCGFMTMATRGAAVAAMQALDEKHVVEGGNVAMAVKWADPDLQYKKRKAVADGSADNRMLFFAKVLRTAGEDDVRALFSTFGHVCEVNLFRAFQGAPTTKGCGLITMSSNDEAVAAVNALDSKYTWEGMDSPMVVKWMDVALQKRRREEHLQAIRQGLLGRKAPLGPLGDNWLATSKLAARPQGLPLQAAAVGPCGSMQECSADLPPLGCAADAYKLFVGNIPKQYTEEDLISVFETVGKVVECYVVRDKGTSESKGSAFIWYQNRSMADTAVEQFSMRHVLPDPTGEQQRPMVVRRANSRKPVGTPLPVYSTGLGMGGPLMAGSEVPVQMQMMMAAQVYQQQQPQQQPQQQQIVYSSLGPQVAVNMGDPRMPSELLASQIIIDPYTPLQEQLVHVQPVQVATQGVSPGGLQGQAVQGRVQYIAAPAAAPPSQPGLQVAAAQGPTGMVAAPPVAVSTRLGGPQGAPPPPPAQQQQQQVVGGPGGPMASMSYALDAGQMQTLQVHLYNLQSMSGAQVSSQMVSPGVFYLTLTGTSVQLEAASRLINTMLS